MIPFKIFDKPNFKNNDYKMIAEFILDKVKETEWFSKLTNNKKRFSYTYRFLSEHKLPLDSHFLHTFPKSIKVYQEANKKSINKK
ncbi:hypothetical protein GCM10007216_30240 [Thalassobacillus devorans]|uniref:Uncharacterized protein n=1 Tax=Thalassobacillus devorans TaxID=279813 RepID=A0ABQ1PIG1_9BACI|nr:hypothetical protein GCM10007216_30240 [Thalassobacillus devorans]